MKATLRGVGSDLYSFFTSVRLAVVLITLIILISLIGIFVPQQDWTREVDYLSRYGVEGYRWLQRLQFDRVFSSWYFLFVVSLFTINLLACTHKRLRASVRYFQLQQRPIPPDALAKMELSRLVPIRTTDPLTVKERAKEILRRHLFRVREEDGQLLAEKWRWERFGIDLFHVSLLVILAGGLMTATMTYRTFFIGHKGAEILLPDNLAVRVDDFFSKNYKDTERVMDWHSQLTVLEGCRRMRDLQTGRTVLEDCQHAVTKVIEVNDPLVYKGYKFFQAAFGQDWMGAAEVTLRIERTSDGALMGEYKARVDDGDGYIAPDERIEVPSEKISIKVEAFLPDLRRAADGTFFSQTQRLENPAAYLRVNDDQGKTLFNLWAFARSDFKALMREATKGLPYQIELVGMRAPEFTGIQVKKDLGQPVAYFGFLLLMAGISIHLFLKHKLIWVEIGPDQIWLAGLARNNPRQFEEEFAHIANEFEPLRVEPRVLEPVNV